MSNHHALEMRIRQQIDAHGGMISFEDFMHMALYEPGLGYYETAPVFGREGDYVTAADMGPWLACALFDLIYWGWCELGRPQQWTLVEQGGGNGRLLGQILDLLSDADIPAPMRIIEIERSERLQNIQAEFFASKGYDVTHVYQPDDLPSMDHVLMFSNELPDAFPVQCFHWQGGTFYKRGVTFRDHRFCWQDMHPVKDIPLPESIISQWPDGYISEWCPALSHWQKQLAHMVKHGFIFTVDYGYSAKEYFRPGRERGTLLAHYQHRVCEDILARPGQQDITAHVNFSALAQAGMENGLHPLLWMSQGAWLAQSPAVQQLIQQLSNKQTTQSMSMLAHAKRLMLPFGMGETFKLLVQSTLPEQEAPEFLRDFRHTHELLSQA